MEKSETEPDKQELNYNSLIKKIAESGDLCIIGMKGTAKTTLLMNIARQLRKDPKNHVFIMETFPKWVNEFDKIPYLTIAEIDIKEKENQAYLEPDRSIIQWSKDYDIVNAGTVKQFMKQNKDCLFLIESLEMEKISAFMTFVIYQIYRKQYQRAKAGNLETVNENFYFLCEESHNLLDSTVIAKKTFNKLRKIQNEFRNLKMHLICVALRLQDLSPKIRSKMSILLSRVSLDDYQLKVRMLLRNSEFRDVVTDLPKGTFIFPELDLMLTTEPFQQIGKPFQWHRPQQPQTQTTEKYPSLIKATAIAMLGLTQWYKNKHKNLYPNQAQQPQKEESEFENEDSELDLTMTDGNDDMFPTDLNP